MATAAAEALVLLMKGEKRLPPDLMAKIPGAQEAQRQQEAYEAEEAAKPQGIIEHGLYYAKDMAKGTLRGIGDIVNNTMSLGLDTIEWLDDASGIDAISNNNLGRQWLNYSNKSLDLFLEPKTTPGMLARGTSQAVGSIALAGGLAGGVATGLTGGTVSSAALNSHKLIDLLALGKGTTALQVSNVIADFAAYDPKQPNMANALKDKLDTLFPGTDKTPGLGTICFGFLATNESDSAFVGRLKNATVGVLTGATAEFIADLFIKAKSWVSKSAEEALKEAGKHDTSGVKANSAFFEDLWERQNKRGANLQEVLEREAATDIKEFEEAAAIKEAEEAALNAQAIEAQKEALVKRAAELQQQEEAIKAAAQETAPATTGDGSWEAMTKGAQADTSGLEFLDDTAAPVSNKESAWDKLTRGAQADTSGLEFLDEAAAKESAWDKVTKGARTDPTESAWDKVTKGAQTDTDLPTKEGAWDKVTGGAQADTSGLEFLDEAAPSTTPTAPPEAPTTPSKPPTDTNIPPTTPEAPTGPSGGTVDDTAPPTHPKRRGRTPRDGYQVIDDRIIVEQDKIIDDWRKHHGESPGPFYPGKHTMNPNTIQAGYGSLEVLDESLDSVLRIGNDLEINSLNRPATEFTPQQHTALVEDAYKGMAVYAKENGTEAALNITMKDMKEMADNIATLPTVIVNSKAVLVKSSLDVQVLLKRIDNILTSEGKIFINDSPEAMKLLAAQDTLIRRYVMAATYWDRISTATARGLSAHRADTSILYKLLTKDSLKETAVNADSVLKGLSPDEKLGFLRKVQAANNVAKQAKVVAVMGDMASKKGLAGKLYAMHHEYWINNILSGPKTHLVNTIGNATKLGGLMPLQRIVAGWQPWKVGDGKGLFTIRDRELWNEGVRAWQGMAYSVKDAWKMAKLSFSLGENILKPESSVMRELDTGALVSKRKISSQYLGLDRSTGLAECINAFGEAVNLPTRFLMSADEFFSQLAARQQVFTDLYTKGEQLFEAGKAAAGVSKKDFILKHINDNYMAYFTDSVTGAGRKVAGGTTISKAAIDFAKEATWTQDLAEGSFSQRIMQSASRFPIADKFVPFVRTPVNILDDAIAHTPVAFLSSEWRRAMKSGNPQLIAKAHAKWLLGSTFSGVMYFGISSDLITGGGPANKAHREALMQTGWRPYSVRVGDSWVTYNRIEPLGTVLGIIADCIETYDAATQENFHDGTTKNTAMTALAAAAFAGARAVTSKTYFQGMADFVDVMDDPDAMEKWFRKQSVSYTVPYSSAVQSVAITLDPSLHEVKTFTEELKSRVPGLSSSIPARHSWIDGKPIQYTGGMLAGFSPIVWEAHNGKNSKVAEELIKLGAGVLTSPTPVISGIELDAQQKSDYYRLHGTLKINGKTLMETLSDVINSPSYDIDRKVIPYDSKSVNDNPRARKVADVISSYRSEARRQVIRLHPALAESIRLKAVPEYMRPKQEQSSTQSTLSKLAAW